MIQDQNVLVVIPARGGSKGIPQKNLQEIGGQSLVEWSLNAALQCPEADRIIVSTDSEAIRSRVNAHGAFAPFLRPAELAQDQTPSLPVFRHALQWAEEKDGRDYPLVVVLEPTCPFRLPSHVREGLQMAADNEATSVMSLVELADHHPVRVKKIGADGRIEPFCIPEPEGLRRQDQEPAYIRNGGVYVFKRQTLLENRLWGDMPYGFKMDPRYYSINIDEQLDLLTARAFYESLKGKGELHRISCREP